MQGRCKSSVQYCTVCVESVCCCCSQDITRLYASCRTIVCKSFGVSLLAVCTLKVDLVHADG